MQINELVRTIKATATRLEVRCDAMGVMWTYHLVEGDHPLADTEIVTYASERIALANAIEAGRPARRGLIATEAEGKIVRWQRDVVLEYAVWRPSFDTDADYNAVVDATNKACTDWAAICGIRFRHRSDLDREPSLKPGSGVFPVIRTPGGGNTIAVAFFPYTPPERQLIAIYDGFFAANPVFDRTGVLRHELGHVLGFRHEHIAPQAPKIFLPEDVSDIRQLTGYDSRSVMHYLGPDVGNPMLAFTDLDRQGATLVYGAPDTTFDFYPKTTQ